MPTPSRPRSLADLLIAFGPCFTQPTMRRYPQCGFSWASRRTRAHSDDSTGGRSGPRCAYVQRRATS